MTKTSTAVGGLVMAILGAAAWWGMTELTEPEEPVEDCQEVVIYNPASGPHYGRIGWARLCGPSELTTEEPFKIKEID